MIPGNANSLLLASAAADAAAAGPIKSLRFNSEDSANLHRTPSSAGNRRTWTFAAWIKLSDVGTSDRQVFSCRVSGYAQIQIGISGAARIGFSEFGIFDLRTERLMRDCGAFFHLCCVFDSSNSTEGDRARIYVNGVRETNFSTETYPSQNAEASWNRTERHNIGSLQPSYANYFDGYMADIYFIDGSALDPTSFGAFNDSGVWQAAAYSGTFGTNGFHLLDFANESTIGHDSSGNENDFTAVNFSTTAGAGNDVLFDTPTNGDTSNDTGAGGEVNGCYAVLNPLHAITNSPTNGNLDIGGSDTSIYTKSVSTIFIDPEDTTGYYCEFTVVTTGTNPAGHIQLIPQLNVTNNGKGETGGVGLGMRGSGAGNRWYLLTDQSSGTDTGVSHAANQVIGVAVKNGKLYMAINNTWVLSGNPATESNPLYSSLSGLKGFLCGTLDGSWQCNWGQRAFSYSSPTGYRPVSSAFLPTPTIADGSTAFDVITATGTAADRTFTMPGGFGPDLVWSKSRNNAYNHGLFDTVRGATKRLISNSRNDEDTSANQVKSFTSDGFVQGSDVPNTSGESGVYWCWDAGSSTVSNTDGSITSSVRASTTNGFSIVKYVGTGANATCGHGLSAAPDWIIFKDINRDDEPWFVYHSGLGNQANLFLNTTAAATTGQSDFMNSTDPTSTVFSLGSAAGKQNRSGSNFLALCWTAVAGFSSFGTYEGTGNSDGPFVFCGFKPRVVIYKNADDTEGWGITDTARSIDNPADEKLEPNTSSAEATVTNRIDILSNGFKIRAGSAQSPNENGDTYIYAAFSENAFSLNGGLAR